MSDLQILAGFDRPILFLKATVKKQVWVPGYTRHDGVVVAAHYAMVHVSDDHDEHKILAGAGSHSQKAAHGHLTKHEWFNTLPHDHKIAVLQEHATGIQDIASHKAVLSTFKKKLFAGAAPANAEWKAFDAASADKKADIEKEAQAMSAEMLAALVQGYANWQAAQPAIPAAPVEVPQPVAQDPEPQPEPAPTVAVAAQPGPDAQVAAVLEKIAAAKLPESNTNYKPVNAKLDALAAAVKSGDVKTILMHGYGSNTYANKAVKLANEALAALGSAHQVSVGQKMGQHTGLSAAPETKPTPPKVVAASASIPTHTQVPATEAVKPESFPKPKAPHVIGSLAAKATVGSIQAAMDDALHDKLAEILANLPKSDAVKWQKVKNFAVDAIAYLKQEMAIGKLPAKPPGGDGDHKDGDTKAGADGGMLVFKDGRWHKAEEPVSKKAASKVVSAKVSAPQAPPAIAGSESIDGWTKTGDQNGYNEGGFYTDPGGGEWYCKFPAGGEKVAKNELLASKLYALAGVDNAQVKLIEQGGKVGLASKIVHGAKQDKAALLAGKAPGILSGFATDAWLANWDTVGNNPAAGKGFDNIMIKPDGTAVRIDAGGALSYGGAGGKKQTFGNKVIELKTMLDPAKNANTAAVFGKMSQGDIAASVAKVAAIPDAAIADYCEQYGPGDAAERAALAAKLIARKADMIAQYPKTAPGEKAKVKKVIKFDPSKLGAAPDFLNWKGPAQSGPASLHAKNVANQEGVNKLLEVAQAGDIGAIKDLTLPFYGSDGAVSHQVHVLEHPSQYVRGFAQQLINEIDAQLNPPIPFRWSGDSPLAAMDKAYPKVDFKAGAAVAKLAKYIKVGNPGVLTSTDAGLTAHKISWGKGLDTSTFAAAAQKVTAKLPQQQKDALKSYTGSGYQAINKSLWTGNPSGAAQSAGEALLTLGHDIPAGTLLSRKISLSGQDLADMQKAAGMILQEPAVMSTSIRPSSWSGSVHFKMTVGPGVKGLYVGPGSIAGGAALSNHPGEDELVLPPNTRMLVQSVKASNGKADEDGFGGGSSWIVEVLILPTT